MRNSVPTRLLAFVVAAGLIVGALAYRNRDNGGLSLSEGSTAPSKQLHLACAADLADLCRAAVASTQNSAVVVETASTTLDRLTKTNAVSDAGIDGWITSPAWADAVKAARERAGMSDPAIGTSTEIARSQLVIVADTSRAASLTAACGAAPTWKCLADSMTKRQWTAMPGGSASWGTIKVGWDDPASTSLGLATLGAHAESFFGRADFDSLDIDSNDFTAWVSRVTDSVSKPFVVDSLVTLLTAGPASYGWVVTTQARATSELKQAANAARFQVLIPTPVSTLDLVYVPVGTNKTLSASGTGSRFKADLANAGWLVPGKSSAASLATLPGGDDLPNVGVLSGLRTKWQQELSK